MKLISSYFTTQNTWSKLCIDTNGDAKGSKLIQTKCDPRQDDQNFQCDLTVRTVKRRRANMCWTLGKLSADFVYVTVSRKYTMTSYLTQYQRRKSESVAFNFLD